MSDSSVGTTFWDHLDELRSRLIKMAMVVVVATVAAFLLKDQLFAVVLAPSHFNFISYQLLGVPPFSIQLINTGLTEQFMVHMRTAMFMGLLIASPYIIYELFRFVLPALYAAERRTLLGVAVGGYALFLTGVAVAYFLIFPLTFRFLGTYSVSGEVENLITLDSYVSTLLTLGLCMGLAFELPMLCWAAGRLGLLQADTMRRTRRHALIAIFVVAAVITPTSDVFTLCLTALPDVLLYEAGILVVARTGRRK